MDSIVPFGVVPDRNGMPRINGKLLAGHPGLPGAGPPRRYHTKTISDALKVLLTADVCNQIATVLIEQAKEGNRNALEILLDRTEGKVIQALTIDTEINVYHSIPRPPVEFDELDDELDGLELLGAGEDDRGEAPV